MGMPVFIENPAIYEVREGRMHIESDDLSLVVPIHVFIAGCERGKRAIAEWQRKQLGDVVQFRPPAH